MKKFRHIELLFHPAVVRKALGEYWHEELQHVSCDIFISNLELLSMLAFCRVNVISLISKNGGATKINTAECNKLAAVACVSPGVATMRRAQRLLVGVRPATVAEIYDACEAGGVYNMSSIVYRGNGLALSFTYGTSLVTFVRAHNEDYPFLHFCRGKQKEIDQATRVSLLEITALHAKKHGLQPAKDVVS